MLAIEEVKKLIGTCMHVYLDNIYVMRFSSINKIILKYQGKDYFDRFMVFENINNPHSEYLKLNYFSNNKNMKCCLNCGGNHDTLDCKVKKHQETILLALNSQVIIDAYIENFMKKEDVNSEIIIVYKDGSIFKDNINKCLARINKRRETEELSEIFTPGFR